MFVFRGKFKNYTECQDASVGDVIVDSRNGEWVYTGDGWMELGSVAFPEQTYKKIHVARTHCKSCGAPLNISMYPDSGLVKCEYCGSVNNIEVGA